MKQFVFFIVCATILITLIPQSYAEYYYQDRPSWSIEYPDGWQVTEYEWGTTFSDGGETSSLGGFGIWKNMYGVGYSQDIGEKLSDSQERRYQIQDNREYCEGAKMHTDYFICYNFQVFHKIEPTYTADGHPIITTVFKYTKNYGTMADGTSGVGVKNMVATSSYIYDGTDIFEFWSEHDLNEFDKNKSTLFNTLNSLRIPALPAAEAIPQTGDGGGCLIATATFGSEMAPQVQFLREIRDNTVLQTESGTSFMTGFNQFYYSFSPAIADYERENPAFKETVKLALTPLLTSLTLLQYADIDSESEMLGYGISVILLNIGMYFVAPAVLIMKIRKRI